MSEGDGRVEITPLTAAAHELKAPLALVRQLSLRLEDEHLTSSQKTVQCAEPLSRMEKVDSILDS